MNGCYYHGITRDLEQVASEVEQWLTKAVLFAFLAASGAVDKASFQAASSRFISLDVHFCL